MIKFFFRYRIEKPKQYCKYNIEKLTCPLYKENKGTCEYEGLEWLINESNNISPPELSEYNGLYCPKLIKYVKIKI